MKLVGSRKDGSDRPIERMWIAQSINPNLFPRTRFRDKRIIVRDAVTAVLAHRSRRGVFVEIGNDPEDLHFEIIQPLRIGPDAGQSSTGPAVAAFQVHAAPVRLA